ncbi:MAG: HEPN domain-containing protein [Muribaculum sp.]|nr:HEPN domain-containing protein [Muribaculum sp.]
MTPERRAEIIAYRKEKSLALLGEVNILLANKLANSAVNRMYYACFHAVSALMIKNNVEVRTHSGIRQAFSLNFVKNGIVSAEDARIFSRIYDKRQASDYDDFMNFSMEEVKSLYPSVSKFVETVVRSIEV